MLQRCRADQPSPGEWQLIAEKAERPLRFKDPLYLMVVYHVLYRNNKENVALSRIQAQHDAVNADLSMTNADAEHVPKTGNFGAAYRRRGNPVIQLLPTDSANMTDTDRNVIRRVRLDARFPRFKSIVDILKLGESPPIIGRLNVYIVALEDSLGDAVIGSNVCAIDYRTVGCLSRPSQLIDDYGSGRALTHQLGHCFSLPHIFTGPQCLKLHDDIPPQNQPNYVASLFQNDQAEWDGEKDNRDLDERHIDLMDPVSDAPAPHPYACQDANNSKEREYFFNFMDLSTDANTVMFSACQAQQMRSYIVNAKLLDLVRVSPQLAVSYVVTEPGVAALVPSTVSNPTVVSNLNTWLGLAVVVVLILIVVMAIAMMRNGGAKQQPQQRQSSY